MGNANAQKRARKNAKLERQLSKYRTSRLRRKNTRFKILYVTLLLILALGGYMVYDYMHDSMLKYEAAQTHALRAVLAQCADMFTSRDYGAWFECEDPSGFTLETERDYAQYADALLAGKTIEYYQVRSDDAELRRYQVTADRRAFAEFSLKRTGETVDCGIFKTVEYWALVPGSIDLNILTPKTYAIEVPETAEVYVNGARVGAEYITSSGILNAAAEYIPPDVPVDTRCVYTLTWSLDAPEFTALNANGAPLKLNAVSDSAYASEITYSDTELRPLHEQYAIDTVTSISRYLYYTNTREMNSLTKVLSYMQPDSEAEKRMRNLGKYGQDEVAKLSLEDMVTYNYAEYGDEVFSCTVKFNSVIQKLGNDYSLPTTYTLFYRKQANGEWKLYDYAQYDLTEE